MVTRPANSSFVMLGLVPSICLRSIGQQILGTRPRMTSSKDEACRQADKDLLIETFLMYLVD
ncbi:hypothetical protein ATY78_25700 [Rhizobium sp. R635]|nr:hypothetical protein ATY78_25700 [Rhizobium sp. R635]